MAKGKAKAGAGKLDGKTVAFVGKFGYHDMHQPLWQRWAERVGARVVEAATGPDYLVAGDGRGGNPPGDVAKIQKKHPAVHVLSVADFVQLVTPDADEFLARVSAVQDEKWWDDLSSLLHASGTKIDLRNADLRKAKLSHAKLKAFLLEGANLSGADVEGAQFGNIKSVNFDGARGAHVGFDSAENCTFRKCDLSSLHIWGYGSGTTKHCDFSGAKLHEFYSRFEKMKDCTFVGADLSAAEIQNGTFDGFDFSGANLTRAQAEESKFDGAVFTKATLYRADLRQCSFKKSDLRNADLREANLSEADLTGANVAGADFAGAVLTGVNLKGLDTSKAKNFKAPVKRMPGPKLTEFAAAATGSKQFTTSVEVDVPDGGRSTLNLSCSTHSCNAGSVYTSKQEERRESVPAPNFTEGMLNASDRWPGAVPRLETVTAKGSKSVRGKELAKRAVAAWAEVFGVEVASEEELQKLKDKRAASAVKERDRLVAKIRSQGVKAWNALSYQEQKQYTDFSGVDFSGLQLPEIRFFNISNMEECNFSGSNLTKASLYPSTLARANFTKANLKESEFHGFLTGANFEGADMRASKLAHVTCTGANFKNANLTSADLSHSKLQAANFTGANLEGANFDHAEYDESTTLPASFEAPVSMVWKGAPKAVAPVAVGSLDFPTFLENLGQKVELARMQKASAMLKAEKFQLYADVTDVGLVGIVKSQSSKDLVYSCRLTSAGDFGCCTQNLMACGGLRGALCKHLLVLVVGLTKAGRIDPATVNAWVDMSRAKKPVMDKDSQSESFLKYKGAEAGEVDWRPTETIPEDFYAM